MRRRDFLATLAAGLTAVPAAAGKRNGRPAGAAPGGAVAPNESLVTARVTTVRVVDSTTVGVDPPQPLAVLTLNVLSVAPSGTLPPAIDSDARTVEAYSRDPDRFPPLRGATITVALRMRGDARARRLWVTRLTEPQPR